MSRLAQSWLIMLSLAFATAALLAMAPSLPRLIWVAMVMAAALVKGWLILLDYLELREAKGWRSAVVSSLALLLGLLTLLAAV